MRRLLWIGSAAVEVTAGLLVAGRIGAGPTVALLAAGSLAGALLLRRQARRVLPALGAAIVAGRSAAEAARDAAGDMPAALLLTLPGLVSTALGLALLLPPARALQDRLLRHWRPTLLPARVFPVDDPSRPGPAPTGQVIEGEVVDPAGPTGPGDPP